jgi:hypothetical protein
MSCPKCKAKVGVMKHEVILDAGVVHCTRCVICGYWSHPSPKYHPRHKLKPAEAAM